MTVEIEPAPRPTPLWVVPVVVAVLALALLAFAQRYTDREVGGFGGRALPPTEVPTTLVDGSRLPQVPDPLRELFGSNVVMAERRSSLPDRVRRQCRRPYVDSGDPALGRLQDLIGSADVTAMHMGPDALTHLAVAVDDVPPGYPNEVEVACVARWDGERWRTPGKPYLDFALDGRPGARLTEPQLRTRLVQVPVGARWAVQPRGGWWLGYEVAGTSWVVMTLTDGIRDVDPMRVTFVDGTGTVVAERAVGPTRPAWVGDNSTDLELVAGEVAEVLARLREGPLRTCAPGDDTICVWLSLNEQQEVEAMAGFGPHPLDTPPMGYVGWCAGAEQLQGSVTSARFLPDGTWAGGPTDRGLDRYEVRFEVGRVVIDLSQHIAGGQAEGEPVTGQPSCEFRGNANGKVP